MMWSQESRELFLQFVEDPANASLTRKLGDLYWERLRETTRNIVLGGDENDSIVGTERDFIDTGWIPDICPDVDLEPMRREPSPPPFLTIVSMSTWLQETVDRIRNRDRESALRADIAAVEGRISRLGREIVALQKERSELLTNELAAAGTNRWDAASRDLVNTIDSLDTLAEEVMGLRSAMARGKFFSASQRRAFVAKEASLQKDMTRLEKLIANVKADGVRNEVRSIGKQIAGLLAEKIELRERISKLEAEIAALKTRQQNMSPAEIMSKVGEEIDYLRDLIRLSARRLKSEPCAVLLHGDAIFFPHEVCACLSVIFEFDPNILRNDRVAYMGKPQVLLVPGRGMGLYDWKNNRIVLPLVPPAGKFLESLVSAIIEYRLDVDEEKTLINSYCKLPHLKGVKSIFQIKKSFTNDYMAWMLSEARGFRVMKGETRDWFEHTIALSKNEIYCPPQFQSFILSQMEFHRRLKTVEERLSAGPLDGADPDDLWEAHILNYQQGNFNRSFECAKAYTTRMPNSAFGHYNLAQVALKVGRKPEAVAAFSEFCRINSASWYAGVAQEHLRRLRS